MSKIIKTIFITMLAIVTLSAVTFTRPANVQAATMTKEDYQLANEDIGNYLANCQQYESSDKTFKGFTSIKQIKYVGKNKINIYVNDDLFALPKARRDLLIDDLQNGVLGTLLDNNLQGMSEKDVQRGCRTTIYLNNQVIGQSSKSNYRQINWKK